MHRFKFVIYRPIQMIPVLIGISLITFILIHSIPGDPVRILLGPRATKAVIEAVHAQYGLDKPVYIQYGYFLKNLLRGDMGRSIVFKMPVLGLISERISATLFHMDPSSRMDHMLVNHSHKPLDDLRVRQAIYHSLNRQAIVDVVTFGFGKVANSFIPAGAMHYNPDNFDYPYDPAKAKKLLADAGVKGLTLDLLVTAGDSVHDQIAVMVKDQLGKVGIDINIVKQEEGQQWDSTVAGEYDISVNYWTNDVIDPDQKSSFCVFGDKENLSYYTRYKNPAVTKLVEQGRTELDSAKRQQIYYDIQRIAKEDVHWIDLYYSPFRNASRANVVNYFQNPMGRFMLEDTYMK